MKIEICTAVVEGFVSSVGFRFDDGLILVTWEKLVWLGKEKKAKTIAQIYALIAEFKARGFEVVGEAKLEEALQ